MANKKFKAGQSIVFEPKWANDESLRTRMRTIRVGDEVYPGHPLKYGDMVLFLADITPALGHCIVTTYEGKVITMLHPSDFRKATDNEV